MIRTEEKGHPRQLNLPKLIGFWFLCFDNWAFSSWVITISVIFRLNFKCLMNRRIKISTNRTETRKRTVIGRDQCERRPKSSGQCPNARIPTRPSGFLQIMVGGFANGKRLWERTNSGDWSRLIIPLNCDDFGMWMQDLITLNLLSMLVYKS